MLILEQAEKNFLDKFLFMRLFIDECISPRMVDAVFELGHYAEHPRNMGALRALDHEVLERCLDRDLIIVTHNARDFRKLVGRTDLHPGLIILEEGELEVSLHLIKGVIEHLMAVSGDEGPDAYMVNRVIEIDLAGNIKDYLLPPRRNG